MDRLATGPVRPQLVLVVARAFVRAHRVLATLCARRILAAALVDVLARFLVRRQLESVEARAHRPVRRFDAFVLARMSARACRPASATFVTVVAAIVALVAHAIEANASAILARELLSRMALRMFGQQVAEIDFAECQFRAIRTLGFVTVIGAIGDAVAIRIGRNAFLVRAPEIAERTIVAIDFVLGQRAFDGAIASAGRFQADALVRFALKVFGSVAVFAAHKFKFTLFFVGEIAAIVVAIAPQRAIDANAVLTFARTRRTLGTRTIQFVRFVQTLGRSIAAPTQRNASPIRMAHEFIVVARALLVLAELLIRTVAAVCITVAHQRRVNALAIRAQMLHFMAFRRRIVARAIRLVRLVRAILLRVAAQLTVNALRAIGACELLETALLGHALFLVAFVLVRPVEAVRVTVASLCARQTFARSAPKFAVQFADASLLLGIGKDHAVRAETTVRRLAENDANVRAYGHIWHRAHVLHRCGWRNRGQLDRFGQRGKRWMLDDHRFGAGHIVLGRPAECERFRCDPEQFVAHDCNRRRPLNVAQENMVQCAVKVHVRNSLLIEVGPEQLLQFKIDGEIDASVAHRLFEHMEMWTAPIRQQHVDVRVQRGSQSDK